MSLFLSQFSKLSFPDLGLVRFPDVSISKEDKHALGLHSETSNVDFLKHLTWDGLEKRRAKGQLEGYTEERLVERLKMEFSTFEKTGVHDYLLMIWDINRWADKEGIIRGWGRGSAASSLTLYGLGITHVNPLRHNLNFPRFLSEARMKPTIKDGVIYVDGKSAPDIDCDYQYGRRTEVVHYLEQKYAGRVCKISTRLELTGKMALKDAMKTYRNASEEEAKYVSDMIEARFGKVQSLYEAKCGDKEGKVNEDVKRWLEKDEKNQETYAIAMAIEGLAVGNGQHPSGVFVCYHPLDGNIPTELSKTSDVVTTYDMETVAGLGIKADILGIRTLDLIANTAAMMEEQIEKINIDDPVIYEYLNRPQAAFMGLFQIEDGTTKEAVVKIGPKDIDALSVSISVSRPGALQYLPQCAAYNRTGKLETIYPAIDKVLGSTGNVLVYQEQITRICNEVFGMSLIDSDSVRYCVGKKKKEEMAKWEAVLYTNGHERGIPDTVIKYFWDVCNASADYLFVLAHATCYSYLSAATTYLKAKYPAAFYLNMLRLAREEPNAPEYMNAILAEMRAFTPIQILPPDILKSEPDFNIEKDAETGLEHIRFGLSSIKGISDLTMSKLATFRRNTFSSKLEVFEAAKAAGVNIAILASLILSGCLSWKGVSRTKFLLEAQLYGLLSDVQKTKVKQFIHETDGDLIETLRLLTTKVNEKGKAFIPESQMNTLRRNYAPYFQLYQHNSKNEELASYMHEMYYLGYSFSSTLFKIYSRKVVGLVEVSDILKRGKAHAERVAKLAKGEKAPWVDPITFVVFVQEAKVMFSQKDGTPYLKLMLSDDSGTVRALLYGAERVEACKRANEGELPKEGQVVICEGGFAKDGNLIFLESVIVQPDPIQLRRTTAKTVEI